MHHCLSRGLSVVNTDVEAGRTVAGYQLAATPIEQREKLTSLLHRSFEKGRDMALRNHQRVTRRDGIAVGEGEAKFPTLLDALRREFAELASAQPSDLKRAQLE